MPADPNGPPKGSTFATPLATSVPAAPASPLTNAIGGDALVSTTDAAFQPPSSPLGAGTEASAKLVYRDLPIIQSINTWSVIGVRAALAANMIGVFQGPSMLVDAMLGDDRIQATLGSRIAGLFGREPRLRPADSPRVKGSRAAKECLAAWEDAWPTLAAEQSLNTIHAHSILAGWQPAQLVWDTTGPVWKPSLKHWNFRYSYFHWTARKFVAISQDGQILMQAGDGKWLIHAPYGEERGWVRGAIRACAEPWLIRHFAIRDWARFSEVHGMPIRKAIVPAAADQVSRDMFEASLRNLGQETTIMVPEGVDAKNGGNRYDLALVEATDRAWEAFPGLRDHCDLAIVLAIKFQNLTTQVTSGGSYAAALQHGQGEVQQEALDNRAWRQTLYHQVARPFAFLNFGDADLAPWSDWDVVERDVYKDNAEQFQKFGTAVEVLRRGGIQFDDVDALRRFAAKRFNLKGLPAFQFKDPVSGGLGGK